MAPLKQTRVLPAALTLALAACGGGGGGSNVTPGTPIPSGIAAEYQGIWVAEAYGRVLQISDDDLRLLDFSSEFCLAVIDESEVGTADVEALFRLRDGELEWFADAGTADFGAPGLRFSTAAGLPESCAAGTDPIAGDAGYQRDARRDLRLMAQLIDEYSIYPELRGISAAQLQQELAASLNADASDEDLVEALFQLIAPFRDIHTTAQTDLGLIKVLNKPGLVDRLFEEWQLATGAIPPLSDAEVNAANTYIGEQIETDLAVTLSYADEPGDLRRAANDQLIWFTTAGTGYLAIEAMIGFGDPESPEDELRQLDRGLDQALADLQDVELLIVDVRRNGGGRDFLSLAIASRFTANETLAYTKQARLGSGRTALTNVFLEPRGSQQYLGPIMLLTSAQTASAAEVFTLALRQLPQVTVLGEATQGGLSDQLDKQLTNGWPVSVANEIYLTPEGEWFEVTGIPVDIEVPQFTREAREAGEDAALEVIAAMLEE